MKKKIAKPIFINAFIALIFTGFITTVSARQNTSCTDTAISGKTAEAFQKDRINFFIISKPDKILDPAPWYNIVRTKLRNLFTKKKFIPVVAPSASDAANKICKILTERNAMIGSLWFDSHGAYKKGYSFFTIGSDEFSYISIKDTNYNKPLVMLSVFCDAHTRIGIGSCYGGASYMRPAYKDHPASRMNGDSLMMGAGNIFPYSNIYACESWVMTKPGLFHKSYALAGAPMRKKFKDIAFEPVWERLGEWKMYNAISSKFENVNTISFDKSGNIKICDSNYLSKKKVQKKVRKNLKKLRPGLLKM